MSSLRVTLLLLASLLLSGGCDRSTPKAPVAAVKVNLVATVYPLADVAREVGGPYVTTSWVVESGQSLSGVQPDIELRNRMRSADLVISGGASEAWASEGASDPVQAQHILRLDFLASARKEQGARGLLWLDPLVVQDLCRELETRLTTLRSKNARVFQERSSDYIAQVDALVQEYRPKLMNARSKKLLVLSTDFNPLLLRFELTPVLAVEASPTQMSETDWEILKRTAREQETRLLLVPADTPQVVIRDLEQRAGVQCVPIDCLGTSAPSGRNTYLEILRYDLDQLVNATSL